MSKPFNFNRSAEHKATYAKWRRHVLLFYGCVGLVAIAVAVATTRHGLP
jgi:hypothetical protein